MKRRLRSLASGSIILARVAMGSAAQAHSPWPVLDFGSGEAKGSRGIVHPPSVWERAAEPVRDGWEHVHRAVGRLLREVSEIEARGPSPAGVQERLTLALHLLEGAGAAEASDVRLRFDLGRVLSMLGEDERAAAVLERALALAPDFPFASDAYFKLAIAYARLGRADDEIAAWGEFLRRSTDPDDRAIVLLNRAEAHMVKGEMSVAIEDYRASLSIDPSNVLAHWGMAVALDRTGDQSGGIAEAKVAIGYDPIDRQLGSSGVFFVPPYDRYWDEGLGAIARAEMIEDVSTSILWWETAVAKWGEYVAAAPEQDRWMSLAKLHLLRCERALEQAKKKNKARARAKRAASRD